MTFGFILSLSFVFVDFKSGDLTELSCCSLIGKRECSDWLALTMSVSFFSLEVMFFRMLKSYGCATDLAKLRSL